MPRRAPRWLGRLAALLAACIVATLVSTLPAGPAAAHGQLAMSQPAKDSTVSEPLESLLLYYTEKPAPNAYFTVTSPSGIRLDSRWSHAEPKQLDKPIQEYFVVNGTWEPRLYHVGFPVRVPVVYWPEQGLYTARYLSVASDGEAVRGELTFTYTGPATTAPAGWQPPTDQADPALLAAVAGTPAVTAPSGGPTISATAVAQGGSGQPGTGLWVWLLPAFVLIAVGIVVVRAGKRTSPASARPASTRPANPKPGKRAKPGSAKPASAKPAGARAKRR